MYTALTDAQWSAEIGNFKTSAFRMELQPAYSVDSERQPFEAFLAGNPQPPDRDLRSWYAKVAKAVAAGKTIQRVRIYDDPPTDYQRWTRWMVRWNLEAGEIIDTLPRARAYDVGLLPDAGPGDWWLFDDQRLVTFNYDATGRLTGKTITTKEDLVQKAREWRHLAVRAAREKTATA